MKYWINTPVGRGRTPSISSVSVSSPKTAAGLSGEQRGRLVEGGSMELQNVHPAARRQRNGARRNRLRGAQIHRRRRASGVIEYFPLTTGWRQLVVSATWTKCRSTIRSLSGHQTVGDRTGQSGIAPTAGRAAPRAIRRPMDEGCLGVSCSPRSRRRERRAMVARPR